MICFDVFLFLRKSFFDSLRFTLNVKRERKKNKNTTTNKQIKKNKTGESFHYCHSILSNILINKYYISYPITQINACVGLFCMMIFCLLLICFYIVVVVAVYIISNLSYDYIFTTFHQLLVYIYFNV